MAEESVKSREKNGTETTKINEPNEGDPCILENKNSSNQSRFFENAEVRLRDKTGLSRVGLYVAIALCILLIVLVIIVLALIIAWPRIPHYLQFPVCDEPACLRAAAQVQERWNSSLSPCDNVWEWACSRWLQNNHLPPERSVWSTREQIQLGELERIHKYITTLELPLHSQTVEWKLKYLYEGCVDMDNINVDKATPLIRIISELDGWYILEDWSMTSFDRNSLITNLQVKYGVSPFFKVSVERNPRIPGAYSIILSPSGLGLPDRYYYYTDQTDPVQSAYKQLIRDVVLLFNKFTRTDAQKFGEDMFSYEKRIAEVTPYSHESINPVNTYNAIKISELKLTVSSLPLQDTLSAMFPAYNVTEETEVIVTSLPYLAEVSNIASSTDKATLNSYLIWTLVREYLPYLSNDFTSTLNFFNNEVYGFRRAVPRWEKCTKLVHSIMGVAVETALEAKYPINHATVTTITEMFEKIKESVKLRISKLSISSPLYKYLDYKMAKLQIEIGLPSITRNTIFLKDYYSKLMVLKASLFDSVKNSFFFKRRMQEKLLISPQPYDNSLLHLVENSYQITYIPSSNTIIIPRAVLTEPEFENEFSSSILYGRFGVQLAEAIISSVLPYGSQWTPDLKLLSPFHSIVNESYEAIGNARNCILHYIENNGLASKASNELTISTLKHLLAVSVAHQALNKHQQDNEHIHQPSLEKLEDSGLFLLTYAQRHCSTSTREQDLYDNVVKYSLTQKSLLQTAWQLLGEFSNNFNCNTKKEKHCSDIL